MAVLIDLRFILLSAGLRLCQKDQTTSFKTGTGTGRTMPQGNEQVPRGLSVRGTLLDAIHYVRFPKCTETKATPHESVFSYLCKSTSRVSSQNRSFTPRPVLVRGNVKKSKQFIG